MTRYDPFAKSPAKPDATRVAPSRQEEDMLFATGEPVKQGPPADSSWELLHQDLDSLLPNAGSLRDAELFAAEILGEEAPAPAQRTQPQKATEPAAPPRETTKPAEAKQVTAPPRAAAAPVPAARTLPAAAAPAPKARTLPAAAAPRAAVRTLPAAETTAPTEERAKTTPAPLVPVRPTRKRHGVSKHAPAIVFGVGAATGAWLALMQRNHVLAAIVGCATLVGVLFTWLWQRD